MPGGGLLGDLFVRPFEPARWLRPTVFTDRGHSDHRQTSSAGNDGPHWENYADGRPTGHNNNKSFYFSFYCYLHDNFSTEPPAICFFFNAEHAPRITSL